MIGLPSPAPFSRESFEQYLSVALDYTATRSNSATVFAARLAVKLNEVIRGYTGDPNFKLDGYAFGPVLFPDASSGEFSRLKFRDFLESFPHLVSVAPTDSGDLVTWLRAPPSLRARPTTPTRGSLGQASRPQLLSDEMAGHVHDILCEMVGEGGAALPIVSLALRMREVSPDFAGIDFKLRSFASCLAALASKFRVTDREIGGLVEPVRAEPMNASLPGFLIVDSPSVLDSLHQMLGARIPENQRPDWTRVADYFRAGFPAESWKLVYVLAVSDSTSDGQTFRLEGIQSFRHYLESTGYSVLQIATASEEDSRSGRMDRSRDSKLAVLRLLDALKGRPCHIVLISEQRSLIEVLRERAGSGIEGSLFWVGLDTEPPAPFAQVLADGQRLRYLNLELDVGAFREPLKRAKIFDAADFDPSAFL